eukprot:4301177-Amphidinium_carterae.1
MSLLPHYPIDANHQAGPFVQTCGRLFVDARLASKHPLPPIQHCLCQPSHGMRVVEVTASLALSISAQLSSNAWLRACSAQNM